MKFELQHQRVLKCTLNNTREAHKNKYAAYKLGVFDCITFTIFNGAYNTTKICTRVEFKVNERKTFQRMNEKCAYTTEL